MGSKDLLYFFFDNDNGVSFCRMGRCIPSGYSTCVSVCKLIEIKKSLNSTFLRFAGKEIRFSKMQDCVGSNYTI